MFLTVLGKFEGVDSESVGCHSPNLERFCKMGCKVCT